MIEAYFKRPMLYDYSVSAIIIAIIAVLNYRDYLELPNSEKSSDFASDIGAIGLTISGFILTIITILITKIGSDNIWRETKQYEQPV